MDKLNNVNQDNMMLKKAFKEKVQQNPGHPHKSRPSARDWLWEQAKNDKIKQANQRWIEITTQPTIQTILASSGKESDYNSDSNNDQLDINIANTYLKWW